LYDHPSFCTYTEKVTPTFSTSTQLEAILHEEKSKFQNVGVIRTTDFGTTLVLDRRTQSTEKDEFIYHESLVHPAMVTHECPKSVFIGGGGEGATAREVLRHKSVERLVMVDIDDAVVQICKKHLPGMVGGCYDDQRMELVIGDAKKWIEDTSETFDVIILDIADPTEGGPGTALYFKSFYETVRKKLNANGIFVTQSGGAGLLTYEECFTVIHNTMKHAFENVSGYISEVPSFGSPWGFNMGLTSGLSLPDKIEVDTRLNERLKDPDALRFYDGVTHQGIFGVPKYIRKACEKETRILTESQQYYTY